jgi:hypothetical protein
MAKYQDIGYGDFGGGIDQLSPESGIKDGYVQELENIDPTPEGSLIKRKGTQLYGTVPVRVNKIEYFRTYPDAVEYDNTASYSKGTIVTYNDEYYSAPEGGIGPGVVPGTGDWIDFNDFTGELCFYLDSTVDVLALRETPIFVYGRTSDCQAAGDFSDENQGIYYPKFKTDLRKSAAADASSGLILEGLSHGQGVYQSPLLTLSTSSDNLSNEQIIADSYTISELTADLEVSVQAQGQDLSTFLVTKTRATELGRSYVHSELLSATTVGDDGLLEAQSFSIEPSVHGLDNFNILVDCYIDQGNTLEKIFPHEYIIQANGRVDVYFKNREQLNLIVTLYATEAANTLSLTLEPRGEDQAYTIENTSTPFPYVQAFEEVGGIRRAIMVDSVAVDTILSRATVLLDNKQDAPVSTTIIWDYSSLVSNKLCVEATDPVAEDFSVEIPGLEHSLGPAVAMELRYSTNSTNTNNYVIQADNSFIDTTLDNVTINLSNYTTKSFDVYGVLANRGGDDVQVFTGTFSSDDYTPPNPIEWSMTIAEGIDITKANLELFELYEDEDGNVQRREAQIFDNTLINEQSRKFTIFLHIEENPDGSPREITLEARIFEADVRAAEATVDALTSSGFVAAGLTSSFPMPKIYRTIAAFTVEWDAIDAAAGEYDNHDLVMYNDILYVSTTNNNPNTPGVDATWTALPIFTYDLNEPIEENYVLWSASTTYAPGAVVLNDDYYYIAKQTSTGRTPLAAASDAYWLYLPTVERRVILADSVSIDSLSSTLTVVANNTFDFPITITAIWDYADYVTEPQCVPITGTGLDGYTDTSPQMTIYGLPHSQLYSSSTNRAPGHVTHVDVYRAEAEERAVCGLGGNLFAAYSRDEVGEELGMSTYYPNLRSRVDSSRIAGANQIVVGPAFIYTGAAANRTAGVLQSNTTQGNTLKITKAEYVSGNNVKYTISTPQRELTEGKLLSDIITTNDYLTIENMGYSVHNGTFQVVDVAIADVYDPDTLELLEEAITITISNPDAASSDFNQLSSGGRAGVFTDSIPLDSECAFLPGDRILSSAWGGEQYLTAITSSSYEDPSLSVGTLRIDGLFREISLPDGLVLVGQRTSRIVPLRTANNVSTTKNIVAGDILSYSEVSRELRAKYINAKDNQTIQVLVNLGQAFASISEDVTTDWMSVGQNILLLDEGVFRGEYAISQIFDQLSFTFPTTANNNQASSGATVNVTANTVEWTAHGLEIGDPLIFVSPTPNVTGVDKDTIYFVADSDSYTENSFQITSVRGGNPIEMSGVPDGTSVSIEYSSTTTLIGNSIEIDEELAWEDSITSVTTFSVQRRWVPVEAPVSGYEQPDSTYYRHFNAREYDDQLPLRSTMVNDTMYLTNGEDAVQRYDGVNITRAGLIRWQPHLYLTADTTDGAILAPSATIEAPTDLKGLDGYVFEVTKGKEIAFFVGKEVEYNRTVDSEVKIVRGTVARVDSTGTSSSYITVNFDTDVEIEEFSTATSQKLIAIGATYSYYYKLNLIDANSNRIVSAVTGAEDAVISISDSSNIRHLLVRPPFLDNFDFSRLEIEVYRTKADQVGPYYRVARLFPEWNNPGDAYLEFVDRLNDINLETQDPLTFQQGQELGQTWTGPLRAKYITSASNSLILANVKDWPKIAIDIEASPTAIISSSSFEGRRWLLRKSNIDTKTDTNNVDRMGFEFLIDEEAHITAFSSIEVNNEENQIGINSTAHGLSVGDWVYLYHYNAQENTDVNPRLGGHYQVAKITPDIFYVTASNKLLQSLAVLPFDTRDVNRYAVATDAKDVPVWLGTDRLYGTKAGKNQDVVVSSAALSAFLRSANAVNSAQAACATEGFKPWVVANAGGEFVGAGIIFETPYVTEDTLEIVLPGFTDFTVIANDVRRVGNEQVQARAQIFPSRLLISYAKYPELFDSPTVPLDTDSLAAVDINPADGQQITGVIPFFGESAFGSAQKDGVLLVFKTASVYIVNINNKRSGQAAVTKIDTRGLGCTAPYSIAPTQNGIMFANQSGIYRITSSYQCQYIGRRLERIWQERVDTSGLDTTMYGHYYPLGNQYKLSVPYEEDGLDTPNRTLVYNTTREYTSEKDGSWTTYSNIPAIGWANMLERPLIATPNGTVLTIRDTGESTDYRDGDAPVVATAILRALDFGSGSVRKAIGTVNIQFKPDENSDNNPVVESAVDLVNQWEPLDLATVSRRKGTGNVSTRVTQQLSVIQFTADRRKGVFFQLRISNSVLDEGLNIAGISLMVKGLSNTAVQQAKTTRA